MKIDARVMAGALATIGPRAASLEALGYDGLYTAETQHDPFFPLVLAAEHTERIDLATAIAVAFPRSPTHLAHMGHDIQRFSNGRFILGLGSQIKAHNEKRFSTSWFKPAARMRELVLAMRAIWACWNDGAKLEFRGDFYTHTLMTPFFQPPPSPFGPPRVWLAAVGELMTEVAGEVCDGLLVHGFTTEKYLRETTIPAVERGLARGGKTREQFVLSCPMFVITGTDDAEREQARQGVCQQIAFYGSTPAYRPVLDAHGWGDLQPELNTLSKQGQWVEMGKLITDDIVDAFAVEGEPEQVPRLILDRYGDVIDRVSFYAPYRSDRERWQAVLAGFKAG